VRRNEISLAVVLLFALFMMTGCVISPRRTLGGTATPTPTPSATPTPTPGATPTPTPVTPTNRLYVSNQNTNSIAVFSSGLSVTGNVAPSATIVGGATTLNQPQFMAFDSAHDRLFVANTAAGTILIFDRASTLNANVAPTRTIGGPTSGLIGPSDVAYDATHDALYVLDQTDVVVYNTISSATVTGDKVPDRDITTPFNTLSAICLDVVNDRLYVAESGTNVIGIYDNVSAIATGVVGASRTIAGLATKLASPAGLTLDPSKNLVVSNAGGSGSITVYTAASIATGTGALNVAPAATITGSATTLATPAQVILNGSSSAGEIIVADSAAGAVTTFNNAAGSGGNTAPTRHIAGPATTITLTGQPTARGVALDPVAR
jgi:6-phosphogluconolactonase (cycloisomerase 2 family)